MVDMKGKIHVWSNGAPAYTRNDGQGQQKGLYGKSTYKKQMYVGGLEVEISEGSKKGSHSNGLQGVAENFEC